MYAVRRFATTRRTTFVPGILYTTEGNLASAKLLAKHLLTTNLAACVQLKEITSMYKWDGKMEEELEIQLTIKCDLSQYTALEQAIKARHSYDVPQIIAVKVTEGSREYLDFLQKGSSK
jgi:periplasmic divalent cation tolerance protein